MSLASAERRFFTESGSPPPKQKVSPPSAAGSSGVRPAAAASRACWETAWRAGVQLRVCSVASSRVTWKLVPPKPKAETLARRTFPWLSHGRGSVLT